MKTLYINLSVIRHKLQTIRDRDIGLRDLAVDGIDKIDDIVEIVERLENELPGS